MELDSNSMSLVIHPRTRIGDGSEKSDEKVDERHNHPKDEFFEKRFTDKIEHHR
jgi:hypothetical protein